jgi:hypothetical protein
LLLVSAAGLATLLFGLVRPARAQTVYGPGGLFVHPSAFVPARRGLGLNVSYFSQTSPGRRTEWVPISLTVPVASRAQVGALHVQRRTTAGYRDSNGVFAKYQITPDRTSAPAFAVAASYLNGDVDQSSVSGVFSHNFVLRGERTVAAVHLGVQWVRRADIADPQEDTGVFVGVEVPLGNGWRLVGETGEKLRFNREAASAYGVMWSGPSGVSVGVGYVNAGRGDDNRFFVGVGYTLGGGR